MDALENPKRLETLGLSTNVILQSQRTYATDENQGSPRNSKRKSSSRNSGRFPFKSRPLALHRKKSARTFRSKTWLTSSRRSISPPKIQKPSPNPAPGFNNVAALRGSLRHLQIIFLGPMSIIHVSDETTVTGGGEARMRARNVAGRCHTSGPA